MCRWFPCWIFAIVLVSCGPTEQPRSNLAPVPLVEPPIPPREDAFARGVAYLLSRQSPDGAWRSEVHGHFKQGDALTPLVIITLQRASATPEINAAIDNGIAWLNRFVTDQRIDPQANLVYPVYTAALTILLLSDPRQKHHEPIRAAWIAFLLERQFSKANDWPETDVRYGGWGYAGIVPQKAIDDQVPGVLEANLSATAYALSALRAAGIKQHPAFGAATIFVQRCQNLSKDNNPRFDDGGYFFAPGDPFRNKAGQASETRFHSYGSATADGRRCEAALGLASIASSKWIEKQFTGGEVFHHHGVFTPEREKDREAAHFYYAASLSETLGEGPERVRIRTAMLRHQRTDGSWSNVLNALREDDPLVATALALQALRGR